MEEPSRAYSRTPTCRNPAGLTLSHPPFLPLDDYRTCIALKGTAKGISVPYWNSGNHTAGLMTFQYYDIVHGMVCPFHLWPVAWAQSDHTHARTCWSLEDIEITIYALLLKKANFHFRLSLFLLKQVDRMMDATVRRYIRDVSTVSFF